MPVDVIILPRGSTHLLASWSEGEVPNVSGGYEFKMDKWRELPLILARRALNNDWSPPEVFLCPRGDLLRGRYEPLYFKALIETARKYCWGAKVFIAVNRQVSKPDLQAKFRQPLIEWFDAVRESGLADLIETKVDRVVYRQDDNRWLSNGAADSRARQRDFQALRRHGSWRCRFIPSASPMGLLLIPYTVYDEAVAGDENLFTVVDVMVESAQRLSAKQPSPDATGKRAVLTCGDSRLRTSLLEELCQRRSLPLLHCGGPFELRHLLMQQLNRYVLSEPISYENCEGVELDTNPIFAPLPEVSPEVCLLLTSSLNPSELRDQELCGKASIVAARLTYRLPPHTNYFAHPALKSTVLPDVLDEVLKSQSELTAWVFLGHGDGREGLYSVDETYAESPELWLTRFEAYRGKSLALVFFSSCRSTDVARRFAQAGVGVAIGFEQNVPAEPCQVLAETVVRAALYTNGNQQEILRAFQYGWRQLSAREYERYGPKAFYSLR